jgi:hypothetical protein
MRQFARCLAVLFIGLIPLLSAEKAPVHYRNTDPSVPYAGSKACAGCHQHEVQEFRHSPMGVSMRPANTPDELARVPEPVTIFNADFDRYFRVFRDGDDLYQSEYQTDTSGKVIFETTRKLEYSVGSGMNGFTYLVRRGDRLFEAPLSYYSKPRKWDLSPGYVAADMGFTRPALSGCLACHNGQPEAVPDREAEYRNPPFRFGEVAIGCEACHGPGSVHIREVGRRRAPLPHGAIDTSIVNPAKLSQRLANDVCMNCHQGGHTRVLQPGKDYTDFRPGTPLDVVAAIFKVPLKKEEREEADKAQVLAPVRGSLEMPSWWKNSSLEMSRCYRASGEKLRCVTCHEVHNYPAEAEKAAYYRSKCLTCHSETSCKAPASERLGSKPSNDCAGCHMPKRPVGGIAHSESTNHRIVRQPGQPLPDIAFDEPQDIPGLVYLNRSDRNKPVPALTQLAAYGETMKKDPSLGPRYLAVLDDLSRSDQDNTIVLAALGRRALYEKEYEKAAGYLSRALERGSQATTTFLDLGDALSAAGKHEDAAAAYQRGIEVSPYAPVLYKSLALEYITLKQYDRAHEVIRRHVELFPEDSFMRGLLSKIEASGAGSR